MVRNEAKLTDLLLEEVEPALTQQMGAIAFVPVSPDKVHKDLRTVLNFRDVHRPCEEREFRKPVEGLYYEKGRLFINIRQNGERNDTFYDTCWGVGVTAVVNLRDFTNVAEDQAVSLILSNDLCGRFSSVHLPGFEPEHSMAIYTEKFPQEVNRHFDGPALYSKSSSGSWNHDSCFMYTIGLEIHRHDWANGKCLEGQEKTKLISVVAAKVAQIVGACNIFVDGKLDMIKHAAMLKASEGEMLSTSFLKSAGNGHSAPS